MENDFAIAILHLKSFWAQRDGEKNADAILLWIMIMLFINKRFDFSSSMPIAQLAFRLCKKKRRKKPNEEDECTTATATTTTKHKHLYTLQIAHKISRTNKKEHIRLIEAPHVIK